MGGRGLQIRLSDCHQKEEKGKARGKSTSLGRVLFWFNLKTQFIEFA
jgi:hypothetical protein